MVKLKVVGGKKMKKRKKKSEVPAGSDVHVMIIKWGPWTRWSANGPLAATVPERKSAPSAAGAATKKLQTTQEILFPRRASQKSHSFTSGVGENAPAGPAQSR